MDSEERPSSPKWVLIVTATVGLIAAIILVATRYYEFEKSKAEVDHPKQTDQQKKQDNKKESGDVQIISNDPDVLTKLMIDQMNDLLYAIERKDSSERLKTLAGKLRETLWTVKHSKFNDDPKKHPEEKYKDEMKKMLWKLSSAMKVNPEVVKWLSGHAKNFRLQSCPVSAKVLG